MVAGWRWAQQRALVEAGRYNATIRRKRVGAVGSSESKNNEQEKEEEEEGGEEEGFLQGKLLE